ncbi:MAG TPA: hypothetical protein VK447_18845 [Myxococcaceae bacterium]|nr:hypothetical protein [Myxococcaceae bacterium]
MKHSVDELLAVIYRYYPRGLYPDDPGYHDTEEHRRLVRARLKAAAEGGPWDVLLDHLYARFPDAVMNRSLGLFTGSYDAGYQGSISLPLRGWYEKYRAVYCVISFLVPYYAVYTAANVVAPVTHGGQMTCYRDFTFTPDEEPYARALTEEILAGFPGYEPMPPEIGYTPLPADIKSFWKGTIYDALFTEAM